MIRRGLARLGWSLLVLWAAASLVFAVLFTIPADPARALVGPHGDAATVERVRHDLCLDRGFVVAYGCYVGRIARGDLGTSFRIQRPVVDILADGAGASAELALAAMFLQLLLGLPLGVLAAVRRGRAADTASTILSTVGASAPVFFIGPVLMYLFGYRLGWFPVAGHGEAGFDRLWHVFLPSLTLAIGGIAVYARLTRSELLDLLGEDFVRTARAKGLGRGAVVVKHALRVALLPLVTLAGLDLGVLLGGAVVTETIFGWPGLGREAVLAIVNVDLPVVLGVTLVAAGAVVAVNAVVDWVAGWLDPRVGG